VGGAALSLFVVGLLGGVHCLGMCGGVVTALTVRLPNERPRRLLGLAYHAGRITTYAAAGALAGALGSAALALDGLLPVQTALYVVAQLMLVALGLYLAGVPRVLAPVERAGALLWRRIQPRASKLFPVRTLPRAYAVGLVWGLVPCGLVYSALATAMVSGSAGRGALLLAAFGAGTLPVLLAIGSFVPLLERLRRAASVRRIAGASIAALGVVGIAHAAAPEGLHHFAALCASLVR
jgi:sulfite exporter TauE/SafE